MRTKPFFTFFAFFAFFAAMSILSGQVYAQTKKDALPFSDFVASGGMIYISGQIGIDPETDKLISTNFKAEADQAMKNIGSILRGNHLTYQDLVSVTIYLTTIENYAATNEVYKKYFSNTFPARVCIAVKELPLKANIEIAAIAKQACSGQKK
jgi:reactive intermediate/imine deaminase